MDNAESNIKHLFHPHDQIQVFLGKPEVDELGNPHEEPRQIMTVWRRDRLIWAGPPDEAILNDPRLTVRTLRVYLPIGSHRVFTCTDYKEIRNHGVE